MLDLIRVAVNLQEALDKRGWQYCFIGGLAVQKWGQVRVTDDVDLTIFTGLGHETKFVDELLKIYQSRMPNARDHAINYRVLLLKAESGVHVDVSLAAFPLEQTMIKRAKKVKLVRNYRLKLCTAEDLIIYKAFASRPIDWFDIEGVIAKQGRGNLDWDYVFGQLKTLAELKEEPEILSNLTRLIDEFSDD